MEETVRRKRIIDIHRDEIPLTGKILLRTPDP